MNYIKSFNAHNEGLVSWFSDMLKDTSKNKFRSDIPVSKRMKENDIKQFFKKDSERISYLKHEEDIVAKIEITNEMSGRKPIILLTMYEKGSDKSIGSKKYLGQEIAIHGFLNYWETKTKEGTSKNKDFKLKKF